MLATNTLRAAALNRIATDTATLAHATLALKAHLIMEDFNGDDPALTLADLVPADFIGSTPITLDLAAPDVSQDPETGLWIISLPDPAGGYFWITTAITNLPQDIFGVVVTNNAGTDTYGIEKFPIERHLAAVGQSVILGTLKFRVPNPFLF